MLTKIFKLLILLCLLLSYGGGSFVADCGTWGEYIECRELDEIELARWNEVTECDKQEQLVRSMKEAI